MKKLIFLFCITLGLAQNNGIRSLNGSLNNSQRLAIDTVSSATFRFGTTNGVHTLYLPYRIVNPSSGSFKWNVSGQTAKYDSLRLIAGSNVSLTQSGNTVTIATSGGGSVGNADSLGNLPASDWFLRSDTVGLKSRLLKNADSTSIRTFSDSLYGRKANTNIWSGTNYATAPWYFKNNVLTDSMVAVGNGIIAYRRNSLFDTLYSPLMSITHNAPPLNKSSVLLDDYYSFVGLSEDAMVALISKDEGGHGSGISAIEVDSTTGNLNNMWTYGRQTTGAQAAELYWSYGTNKDYTLNSIKMFLDTLGNWYLNKNSSVSGVLMGAYIPRGLQRFALDTTGRVTLSNETPSGDWALSIDTYSTAQSSVILGRKARGTQSAPTQTLSGDVLLFLSGRGYTNSSAFGTNNVGVIRIMANENVTSSAQGTFIDLATTPNGTTSRAVQTIWDNSNGTSRITFGSIAGTGRSGRVYLNDSGYIVTTQIWDASRNLLNIGTISSGAITSTGLSTFDSLKVKGKIKFQSNISSSVGVVPMQLFADTTQQNALFYDAYLVRRTVDLTHNTLIDSQYVVNTTTETALDTIVMGVSYPRIGKYIQTYWSGDVNATGGSSKTFKFRLKKGTTVIDSVTYTTPPGGSTSKTFEILNTLNFKTVGSTGRLQSVFKVTTENGVTITHSYATINTATLNLLILTVEMGTANAGVNIKLTQGFTTTRN